MNRPMLFRSSHPATISRRRATSSGAVLAAVLGLGSGGATAMPATDACGQPGSGDCQVANQTPGCEDQTCCERVCAVDSFCCDSAWDATCVGLAATGCFDGPPPDNDTCGTATDLGTGDQAVEFSTLGAGTDGADLPATCESFGSSVIYADVWYRWVASANGPVVISTCNAASFDTRLAVFEGSCGNPSLVGCNNDAPSCGGLTSELQIDAVAGTAYLIQLGSWAPLDAGTGLLTVCEGAACLGICVSACDSGDVPEGEGCGPGTNDGCNVSPEAFQPLSLGETVCGTFWASGGVRDTDWYEFTLSETSIVTWEIRSDVPATALLLSGACPDPPFEVGGVFQGCPAVVEACLGPGTHLAFIAAGGFEGLPCLDADINRYRATLAATPVESVPGDVCQDPIVIGSIEGEIAFDTRCAATDGVPLPTSCRSGGSVQPRSDIFLQWTVPTAGDWRLSTCGTADFDTWLVAREGCGGNVLGCNDDAPACTGDTSSVELAGLSAGATVLIQIGSPDGSQGLGSLLVESLEVPAPVNDRCSDAIPLLDGETVVRTVGATTDGGDLPEQCNSLGNPNLYNDVWYEYVPGCAGSVSMSFCADQSTTLDTKMAVYENTCDGVLVACSDDACGPRSEVVFDASCDTSYVVRIGSFAVNGFGEAVLQVACSGEPCSGCPADFDGDGTVGGADIGLLLLKWGPCGGCPEDLTGDGVVGGADFGLLLVDWGVCQ